MLDIFDVFVIFATGSLIGWFLESIFRSLVEKKPINAGFLNGPYLPIYGFGIIFLYTLSLTQFNPIIKILVFTFSATLLELVTGYVFAEFFNIRLWDYSEEYMNFKGYICLLYTMFWLILGSVYFLFMARFITGIIDFFNVNHKFYIFIGIFYGIFIVDALYSLEIAYKLKAMISKFNSERVTQFRLNYDLLKSKAGLYFSNVKKKKFFSTFFFTMDNIARNEVVNQINAFLRSRGNSLKSGISTIIKKVKPLKKKNKKDVLK